MPENAPISDRSPPAEALPRLVFGALAPSLAEQLAPWILTPEHRDTIRHCDLDAEAVSRLYVRGFIPKGVASRARDLIARAAVRTVSDL